MGGMVDIITAATFHRDRDKYVQWSEYKARNAYERNEYEAYFTVRREKKPCKYNSTYSTGGPKASVMIIVFMFDKRGDETYSKGEYIH